MNKFVKAEAQQAFLKVGLYGQTGSGKTFTSLLLAEGLARHSGKKIAYVDTERGTDFYAKAIRERKIHPEAFDFDALYTRAISETVEAVEGIDPKEYGVVVIDSITHLWEAAKAAYMGKIMSNGAIPVQAWGGIKKPYKKLMSLFLDGQWHGILCGREGVVMETDSDGEAKVVGHKMKAEGETPYEPHILGRMIPARDKEGGYIINVFFEKDRSGILTGKTVTDPSYDTFLPVVGYLSGGVQGQLEDQDTAAERDAAAQERQIERDLAERTAIFEQIRQAIIMAKTVEELSGAWSLTKGKKTKLGDEFFERLTLAKDARKSELMGA